MRRRCLRIWRARDDGCAPMRPIRSSTSAPPCAARTARSMPAATSRTPPTRRACAPRPRRSPPWSPPASGGSLECVVIGPGPEALITPCGGCRQKLREFAADDMPIHLCGPEGVHRTVTWASCCRCRSARTISRPKRMMTPTSSNASASFAPARRLRAAGRRRAGLGPRRLCREVQSRRHDPLRRAAGLSGDRRVAAMPASWSWAMSAGTPVACCGPRALLRARPRRRDEGAGPRHGRARLQTLLHLTNAAGSLRPTWRRAR